MEIAVSIVIAYFMIHAIILVSYSFFSALARFTGYINSEEFEHSASVTTVLCFAAAILSVPVMAYNKGDLVTVFQWIFIVSLTLISIYYTFKVCMKIERWYEGK